MDTSERHKLRGQKSCGVERDLPLQFTSVFEVKNGIFLRRSTFATPHPGGSDIYALTLIYLSILVVYDTGR